jgi:hypothetical protein
MTQTKPVLGPRRFAPQMESSLKGVSNAEWFRFVVMMGSHKLNFVSKSGRLGGYGMTTRRLVELKLGKSESQNPETKTGKQVFTFRPPWTQAKFLANPRAQYVAFSRSMRLYHTAMQSGVLQRPEGLSLAGALCVLHFGGRGALQGWPKLFGNTQAQYERVRKLF